MEIAKDKTMSLNNGDDAEEAVIQSIEKTGQTVLQEWASQKEKQAQKLTNLENCRQHEKKIWHTTLGTICIEEKGFLRKKTRREVSHRLHPTINRYL
jgi:hypothetical protein